MTPANWKIDSVSETERELKHIQDLAHMTERDGKKKIQQNAFWNFINLGWLK